MQQGVLLVEPSGKGRFFARRHARHARRARRAATESSMQVEPVRDLTEVGLALSEIATLDSRLGMCLDVLSVRDYLAWQQRLPGVRLKDISPDLQEQKRVKDTFEIQPMTQAG